MLRNCITPFISDFCFKLWADIIIPVISFVVIGLTYCNQRRVNKTSQFESTFWKIGGENACYNQVYDAELAIVNDLINKHFKWDDTKLSASRLICLLNIYWKEICCNENQLNWSFKRYFTALEMRLKYTLRQSGFRNLIKKKDIPFYVNTICSELTAASKLPFYSFICSEVYSRKLPVSILPYICPEITTVIEIEDPTGDCKILSYSHEEDYGYNYSECKNEPYTETIKRLNINE